MAESLINIRVSPQKDEEETKVEIDSGDGDDYSSGSGSDRSFEADDVDTQGGGDAGSGVPRDNTNTRCRRKRRHGSHGHRRHKGGSRHKHKGFQPYPSKDEINLKRKSQELQEKENAAAVVRRSEGADQQIVTFPVAPFNSTQYLMDEHSLNSPASSLPKTSSSSKLCMNSPQSVALHSVSSTPMETNSEIMSLQRKDKEFVDIYTTVHAESLQSLPKEELVKHYMSLEEKVATLQKKVAEAEQQKQDDDSSSSMRDGLNRSHIINSLSSSDTDSLSSGKEEFIDLTALKQPTISVGENVEKKDDSKATTQVGAS